MNAKYSSSGEQILQILDRNAKNFSNWMFEQVLPHLHGNILEVGSGKGTYSNQIISSFNDSNIILSDIDLGFVNSLKKQFEHKNKVSSVKIDLENSNDFLSLPHKIDSAYALNVLEHVENDLRALKNIYNTLSDGGKFIVLVPAHKFLFNCIDSAVGHFRRYSKIELINKAESVGFKINTISYFNFFSIFGWLVNGNLLKKEVLNEGAVGFFDKLIPFFKFFEKHILRKKMGISLIAVFEKSEK